MFSSLHPPSFPLSCPHPLSPSCTHCNTPACFPPVLVLRVSLSPDPFPLLSALHSPSLLPPPPLSPSLTAQLVLTWLRQFGASKRVSDLFGSKDLLNVVARNVKRGLTVRRCWEGGAGGAATDGLWGGSCSEQHVARMMVQCSRTRRESLSCLVLPRVISTGLTA